VPSGDIVIEEKNVTIGVNPAAAYAWWTGLSKRSVLYGRRLCLSP
jgi:hypothetical protein